MTAARDVFVRLPLGAVQPRLRPSGPAREQEGDDQQRERRQDEERDRDQLDSNAISIIEEAVARGILFKRAPLRCQEPPSRSRPKPS